MRRTWPQGISATLRRSPICECWRDLVGIKVRLIRNFDKTRGFVNGATGTVCESLQGYAVFTVQLHGTGNLVLVYPMEEDGALFLPCWYGYATTIRRAQGAPLVMGCVWFNQKRYAAGPFSLPLSFAL